MAEQSFENSLLLVTGGGNGIGRAICKMAAERGCRIIAADIVMDAAQGTVSALKDSSKHMAIKMDVTSSSSVEDCFNSIKKKYSSAPSHLVNCAGVVKVALCQEHSEEDFNNIINVSLKGAFLLTKSYFKFYKEMSLTKGAIVNMGSIAGRNGSPFLSIYAAAKAGMEAFTKSTSKELGSFGIRVNCVRPGLVNTNMTSNHESPLFKAVIEQSIMKRSAEPEEVAELVVFLLSDKSSFTTGSVVDICGGL